MIGSASSRSCSGGRWLVVEEEEEEGERDRRDGRRRVVGRVGGRVRVMDGKVEAEAEVIGELGSMVRLRGVEGGR